MIIEKTTYIWLLKLTPKGCLLPQHMIIAYTIKELRSFLNDQLSVGFVPTMGALHKGHLSLIQEAKKKNTFVVCSIFVNPTQFNDKEDLNKYPRPIEKDQQLLIDQQCDVLFLPNVEEIYPDKLVKPAVSLNGLDQVMEGTLRPGHFEGVVQVVHRLLDIVKPNDLYMGQKDYQQFCIIRHMIEELSLPMSIHMCPIIREPDGLAMSSRNIRLSPTGREQAVNLYKSLILLKESTSANDLNTGINRAKEFLDSKNLIVEYLEVVDGYNLESVVDLNHKNPIIACLVVRIDGVRLLDNMIIKE